MRHAHFWIVWISESCSLNAFKRDHVLILATEGIDIFASCRLTDRVGRSLLFHRGSWLPCIGHDIVDFARAAHMEISLIATCDHGKLPITNQRGSKVDPLNVHVVFLLDAPLAGELIPIELCHRLFDFGLSIRSLLRGLASHH